MNLEKELQRRIIHHKFNVIANCVLAKQREERMRSNDVDIPYFIKQATDTQMEDTLFSVLKDMYRFEREKFDKVYEIYYNELASNICSEYFGL